MALTIGSWTPNNSLGLMFSRIESMIAALNANVASLDSTSTGSVASGNGFVNGIFGAQTLATTLLHVGNVANSSTLLTIDNSISVLGSITAQTSFAIANSFTANSMGVYGNLFKTGNNFSSANSFVFNGNTFTSLLQTIGFTFQANTHQVTGFQFVAGNEVELDVNVAANVASITINLQSNAGFGVGGSNNQVQYNANGVFGGNTFFTYTANTLSVPILSTGLVSLSISDIASFDFSYNSVSNNTIIDSVSLGVYSSIEYSITATTTGSNNVQFSKFVVLSTGTDVIYNEHAIMYSNTRVATLSANANSTFININLNNCIGNTLFHVHRTRVQTG